MYTKLESQILGLLASGMRYSQIADELRLRKQDINNAIVASRIRHKTKTTCELVAQFVLRRVFVLAAKNPFFSS